MFRHPKYYKELRKRNKSDQAISLIKPDGENESVRPGPGLKLGEMDIASSKQQASSTKLLKPQAASVKPQAQRLKLQATSFKRQDP
jgi:hypothetical protein